MIREAVAELQRGSVLLLFPEGTRSVQAPINAHQRASIGVISKHAAVPVQTLIIETDSPYVAKGWPLLRRPPLPITYRARLGSALRAAARTCARSWLSLRPITAQSSQGSLQSKWLGA
jgi:1-acyl-sn-glycerol-3-phosphate acyltransferase